MKTNTWCLIGATAALAVLATGCNTFQGSQSHHASSLFAYLYPNQSGHVDQPAVPVLSLPLRVGIAFVPEDRNGRRYAYYRNSDDDTFTETDKQRILQNVADEFKTNSFIGSIETIPSAYLTPGGGFGNLDQIKTMYGVDVMVLLARDQVQFTDHGLATLSYWTIVGAWVIDGEKNDTRTMLDAAVYDIASRKLLFRAPGFGNVKASSTPVNLSEQLRKDSELGYNIAATNLTANLGAALDQFRVRVKESPTDYQIIKRPGYTGGGAFDAADVTLVGGLGAFFFCLCRRGKK